LLELRQSFDYVEAPAFKSLTLKIICEEVVSAAEKMSIISTAFGIFYPSVFIENQYFDNLGDFTLIS
jgi:hypothetical protein